MEIQSYILYEDRDLIVCRKPAGVPVQTKQIQTKDMVSLLKNYRYQQEGGKEEPYLGVIHRLDQPVEGIVVFAKTPQAAKELNRQLHDMIPSSRTQKYKNLLGGILCPEKVKLMQ